MTSNWIDDSIVYKNDKRPVNLKYNLLKEILDHIPKPLLEIIVEYDYELAGKINIIETPYVILNLKIVDKTRIMTCEATPHDDMYNVELRLFNIDRNTSKILRFLNDSDIYEFKILLKHDVPHYIILGCKSYILIYDFNTGEQLHKISIDNYYAMFLHQVSDTHLIIGTNTMNHPRYYKFYNYNIENKTVKMITDFIKIYGVHFKPIINLPNDEYIIPYPDGILRIYDQSLNCREYKRDIELITSVIYDKETKSIYYSSDKGYLTCILNNNISYSIKISNHCIDQMVLTDSKIMYLTLLTDPFETTLNIFDIKTKTSINIIPNSTIYTEGIIGFLPDKSLLLVNPQSPRSTQIEIYNTHTQEHKTINISISGNFIIHNNKIIVCCSIYPGLIIIT